jgi:hypothetical protein
MFLLVLCFVILSLLSFNSFITGAPMAWENLG